MPPFRTGTLGRSVGNDIGNQAGEPDVVRANGKQDCIELALLVGLSPRRDPSDAVSRGTEFAAHAPVGGHSRARSGFKPRSMVEPEQASGRNVTALCGFSIAIAIAART